MDGDAYEDEAWDGFDSEKDLVLETIENMRKEEERRKGHARLSGHTPVQELEAVEHLFPPASRTEEGLHDGVYVDGTFGRGGHSRSILTRLSGSARLVAFDVDPTAVAAARGLELEDGRFRVLHRPFGEMGEALAGERVDGVLLDIGVSSPQVDNEDRGFRVEADAPLDMRMNPRQGVSAGEWLQNVSAEELAWVIRAYGETNDPVLAERIAESVLARQRRRGPFASGRELSDVVKQAKGPWDRSMHPAKLTFQAIRMFLNRELEQLRLALDAAFERLVPGGRCVVITFKSLEKEVVNAFVREREDPPPGLARSVSPSRLCELYPLVATGLDFSVRRLRTQEQPSNLEYLNNPRSRSSRIMVLQKAPRWSRRVHAAPRAEQERFRVPPAPPLRGA